MKKKAFVYFVLVITIINLSSLGVIIFHHQKKSVFPYQVKGQNVFELVKRGVKLTPFQIKQFQALRTTFHSKLDSLSKNVGQKNKRLATEIKKADPDTAIINQLVTDISVIQTKSQYLVIHHFYSIKKILTAQQQKIFFSIVLQRFLGKNQLSDPDCIQQKRIPEK